MDPGTKIALFIVGLGAVAGLGWLVFRRLFGDPPGGGDAEGVPDAGDYGSEHRDDGTRNRSAGVTAIS